MTRLRQLWLMTALGAVAVLAGGYFLLVSPKSSEAASLRDEAKQQQNANQGLRTQIDQLNKQKKDLPKQQQLLAEFAGKIPNNPALPALIRSLSDAADTAGVELLAVTPQTPSYSKGVDPTTGVTAPGNLSGPNGTVLVDVPVGISVAGNYSNLTQFFSNLEGLRRAMVIGGLSITHGADPTQVAAAGSAVASDTLIATVTAEVMMTTKAPVAPAPAPVASTDATK